MKIFLQSTCFVRFLFFCSLFYSLFFAESIHVRWISISRYISPRVTFNLTANIFLKSSCISFHPSKNPHPHPPTCAPNVTFLVACTSGRIIFHVFSPPRISSNCLHLYEKKAKTYRRFVEEQVNIRICELRSMKNCRKIEILIPPSCFLSWLLLQFLHLSLIPICLLLPSSLHPPIPPPSLVCKLRLHTLVERFEKLNFSFWSSDLISHFNMFPSLARSLALRYTNKWNYVIM